MLSLVMGASTHAFELMLAAFIFGLAMGGLWVRKRVDRFRDLIFALAAVQVRWASPRSPRSPSTTACSTSWPGCSGPARGEAGYAVFNLVNHAFALAIMLPATFSPA